MPRRGLRVRHASLSGKRERAARRRHDLLRTAETDGRRIHRVTVEIRVAVGFGNQGQVLRIALADHRCRAGVQTVIDERRRHEEIEAGIENACIHCR